MKLLTIKSSDFKNTIMVREKLKLYNIYGKQYVERLPDIYEKVANILNGSDTFTVMVYKSLYNKDFYDFSLKEIEKLFENYKQSESELYDIYISITRELFFRYINFFLQGYIVSKEPALSNCEGVKDIQQCDFIIERYHEFIDSLNFDATPSMPQVNENGCIVINKGDLFHGTKYSEETLKSIASRGLESGQLHGIEEDGETFCCIDFFKCTKDSTPDEICSFGKQYTNGPNQIVFVIKDENIHGSEAMFPNLTDYDAYDETTVKGKKARELVNVKGLPLDYFTGAAILMGVPPCMISSIIVNSEIEKDNQKIEYLCSLFPKSTIVSRTSGTIIRQPVNNYKR